MPPGPNSGNEHDMQFGNIYSGKRVLVTGDTGFKGSTLAWWLAELGADILGISLEPQPESHYTFLKERPWKTIFCDIRNREMLKRHIVDFSPEIVFHLAAQPLVRLSYAESAATFDTNVTGTLNLLEAVRALPSCRSVVVITSDKCYENREDGIPCTENDPMGGFDPYSASKGCAELLTGCYQRSFFANGNTLVASARAGNVIGGGDWAADRLIPDLMRAAASGKEAVLRNPEALRPWQHVFEPLSGYLLLGARLYSGDRSCVGGWNFGPAAGEAWTVRKVADKLQEFWPKFQYRIECDPNALHEAKLLQLDCSKSRNCLEWFGVWDIEKTLKMTAKWYALWYEQRQIATSDMLHEYISDAAAKGLIWTK